MDERRTGVVTVSVAGTPLTPALYDALVEVRVEQSVYVPDRFTLRFRDPGFALLDAGFLDGDVFSVGVAVDIAFGEQGSSVPVVQAEVTQVAADLDTDDRQDLVVAGLDRGHRLARGTKVRSFVNQSAADLARLIAGEYGLTADVDASPTIYEYLLQSSTDYAFLTERARSVGFDWWVEEKTLHFKAKAAGTSPVLTWGENLRRFKMRFSTAESAEEVQVHAWDPTGQRAVVGRAQMGSASGDGVALATTAPVAAALIDSAASSGAFRGTRFTGAAPVASPDEANALARSLAHQASSEQLTARGEAVGSPRLRAGTDVEVEKMGARLSGTWRLTTVEHVVTHHHPYRTRFTSGGKQSHSLVDLLGGDGHSPLGPVGMASGWGVVGLVVGIVTNNNDPEKLGRVKVKFPTLGEQDESAWARVVSVGAGAKRGLQVLPDVNDEVLVGFEHGERRRPLILGGLWSAKQASPQHANAAGKGGGVWQSRAGHAIALSDGEGQASRFIALSLADGKTELHLGEDEVRLRAPSDVGVTSDKAITLTAQGDLTIDANNITLRAKGKVTVEGAAVETKARGRAKTDAAVVEINAQGSAKVSSTGVTEVKGSLLKLN